jgi:hypothetical protein
MGKKGFAGKALLFAAAMGFAGLGQSASARDWHTTPSSLATEYTQIVDTTDKRVVFLWWISAPAMNEPTLAPILEKYFILGIAKAEIDPTIDVKFVDLDAPGVLGTDGKPLKLVKEEDQPPGVVTILAGFKSVLVRAIGPMGKGMKLFVYEPGPIGACKPGKVSIPLNGEVYTYDTPIPGCPKP